MYKKLIVITLIIVSLTRTQLVAAQQEAGQSARLLTYSEDQLSPVDANVYQLKRKVIRQVLAKYNSPLLNSADTFVDVCLKYNLNCYLLPAISGVESTYGRFILPDSYNPFGWGGGYMMFRNWSEAIDTVGKGLRTNYIDKGATTISQIGRIYAPPSTTWASRVEFFVKRFYNEEQKVQNVKDLL